MGKRSSKLSSAEIKDLMGCTYFDKRELQKWYKDFVRDCPNGVLRQQMKPGKARGPSGVVAEMLSAGGHVSVEWLTDLFNKILAECRIPADLTNSVLVLLHKRTDDPMSCGSYRVIKLLNF